MRTNFISILKNKLKQFEWLRYSYHRSLIIVGYFRNFGVVGGLRLLSRVRKKTKGVAELRLKDYPHPIFIRRETSDVPAFEQIFATGDYDFDYLEKPGCIIDAGAYIGISSVYFSNRFPNKKVIAIEPDHENFSMLLKNTKKYDHIHPYHAALWNRNTRVKIVNEEATSWSYQVAEIPADSTDGIQAITIDEIMQAESCKEISILKLDIEGAEKNIFSAQAKNWLPFVHCLVIEIHDRINPGSSEALKKAIENIPHRKEFKGENEIYFFDLK